jgi:hypothetical protein
MICFAFHVYFQEESANSVGFNVAVDVNGSAPRGRLTLSIARSA